MPHNIKVASYPPKGKAAEAEMPQKLVLISLIVICITLIAFTWITRSSLCELRVKQGDTEVAAILAYEAKR